MSVKVQGIGHVDKNPDSCPICLHAIEPKNTGQQLLVHGWVEIVFCCPRQACGRFFVARYKFNGRNPAGNAYALNELAPTTIAVSAQSATITNVSPDFVSIFAEAEKAEKYGLKLVCGPGYRKALEFLIKDYVIRSHEGKAEEIKKLLLGKCISDYVTDERVKQVAARAVWLGNDETHYLRKWGDKDLADLKHLLMLTVHWIEMDELTKQALKDMPEGK